MNRWKIACVQMSCQRGDKAANIKDIQTQLRTAVQEGTQLVIFPEAIVTGYCFASLDEAKPFGESIPGPTTAILANDCKELNVWAIVGMLETDLSGKLYNVAVLIGPQGVQAVYRKVHLPFLGVDRFTTSGSGPFEVHDLGGLKIGMLICYDGSFPEAARCLMLQGADLIVLPTNWPEGARMTATVIIPTRALENAVYFAACDRVGIEEGFHFIGMSRIVSPAGASLAFADHDQPAILYAEIDPELARKKHLVFKPGSYELDRVQDRHPELYGPLVDSKPASHDYHGIRNLQ